MDMVASHARSGCVRVGKCKQFYCMFMRYRPKEFREVNRMVVPPSSSRGKRHFWGDSRGDYGLYQSVDYSSETRAKPKATSCQPRRVHTVAIDYNQQQEDRYEPTEKKPKLNLNKNFSIHLPPIPKVSQSAQTDISRQKSSTIEKKPDHAINQSDVYEQIPRQNKLQQFSGRFEDRGSDHCRIRYSPTFVCSVQNPLPVFKLIPRTLRQYL